METQSIETLQLQEITHFLLSGLQGEGGWWLCIPSETQGHSKLL